MNFQEEFIFKFNEIFNEFKNNIVAEVYQNIDSRVFLGFGDDYDVKLSNGKTDRRKGKAIWICSASWRLTHNGRYIIGSGDEHDEVHEAVYELMGRRFLSMKVTSYLMDVQLQFDEGYVIDTFARELDDAPWALFYFDEELFLKANTDDERKKVYELAQAFDIPNIFTPISTDIDGLTIMKAEWPNTEKVILHVRRDLALILDTWAWRLLKSDEWVTGCSTGGWDPDANCFLPDNEQIECCLRELEGKVIKRIEVANNMLDARFYIGDEYVLEMFVSCKEVMNRWGIYPGVPEPSFYAPPDSVFENAQSE